MNRFAPLAVLAAASLLSAQTHDQIAGRAHLVAEASALQRTKVAAHLQHPLDPAVNLMWCATMQLAWDELGTVFGSPPRLAERDPVGDGLAARLTGKDQLDPGSYVACAGFVRDGVLDRIAKDLARTFGKAAAPRVLPRPEELRPDDLLAYAYLWKQLPFALPFQTKPMRFVGSDVEAFGAWTEHGVERADERRRQLEVLSYQDPAHFLVALRTKGKGDRLLIARGTPGATLQETVVAVMARAGGKPEPMEAGDRFQMPKLDFDVTRNYHELVGKGFANEGFAGYVITRAAQNVRFRLDENGAILKSDAVIEAKWSAPEGRRMVCDGPFLVLLARAGQTLPYFALWVANDELLVRAGGTTATGAK